jgi:hypothetical protein
MNYMAVDRPDWATNEQPAVIEHTTKKCDCRLVGVHAAGDGRRPLRRAATPTLLDRHLTGVATVARGHRVLDGVAGADVEVAGVEFERHGRRIVDVHRGRVVLLDVDGVLDDHRLDDERVVRDVDVDLLGDASEVDDVDPVAPIRLALPSTSAASSVRTGAWPRRPNLPRVWVERRGLRRPDRLQPAQRPSSVGASSGAVPERTE